MPAKSHGMSNSAEYRIWRGMLNRCSNPNVKAYPRYGGRGIKVCERWLNFNLWLDDLGMRPSQEYSIERVDGDGDYEPGNVIWADKKTQARNTARNRILEYQGQSLCLAEWAEKLGIDKDVLSARLSYGWSVARTLTTPVKANKGRFELGHPNYKTKAFFGEAK